MVVIGAKGHAIEILDVLHYNKFEGKLSFFDNVSPDKPMDPINKYMLIRTEEELKQEFKADPNFILGTGNPRLRKKLSDFCQGIGGELFSLISNQAYISPLGVSLEPGLNIMHGVKIQPMVSIGEGSLINAGTIIHHQSVIGSFCEIGPGCMITGNVRIGNNSFLGTGVKVLPGITIGENVVIAGGTVVTRDIPSNVMIAGVPGVEKKKLP